MKVSTRDELEHHVEAEQRVTPLELFFDLVFVFGLTQVTSLMSAHPTWSGLARGMLVLAALWWAWTAYAWLTNTIDPDEGGARLAVFGAMAAMLIVGLAAPGAFDDDALLFGAAYLAVRVLHIVLYALAADDEDIRGAVMRLAPTSIVAPGLILGAAALDGTAQGIVWLVALAVDYSGPLYGGGRGWRVFPAHFAERHGLIVIIALGESIVAIGIGAAGIDLGGRVVLAAILGVVVSAALWWSYFDVVAIVAERKMTEAKGVARSRIARDSYSYLHLPMVAGIILLALGVKKTIGHVDEPLESVPAVALCGGVALYYLAHIAFRLRNVRSVNWQRLVAALGCLALIPVATNARAIVGLAAIAGLCAILITYEAIRFREARARVRTSG
ncbi:MAG TPA: low temperature requirement protein A [Gaiellaceae bacterium]|jgi:low temperature requirement protein LtrA|nr:low temperature requirement protein A [Gaiellaceae bacterium]